MNSKEELLLGQDFEQFANEATDTTIYSFRKIIKLLINVNPNIIEIMGLKPEHYLAVSKIGQRLLDNKELFLSKRCVYSFGGYANQQLYRLQQKSNHSLQQAELEKHILNTLKFMENDFKLLYTPYDEDNLKLYIGKSDREDMETEIYMDVNLHHYPLRDYCGIWNTLQNCVRSYNKLGMRNSKAIEHGKISKHAMHLLRLHMMCLDILEKHEINTYREKNTNFL